MASIKSLVKRALQVNHTVVDAVEVEEDEFGADSLVISLRPDKYAQNRCPHCHAKCPRYDKGRGMIRRWRALSFGHLRVYIEFATYRVTCPKHGEVTAGVPWASGTSTRFTSSFEYEIALMATMTSNSATAKYFGIDWGTVNRCRERVGLRLETDHRKRFDGLVRIGVDETSYTKGQNYVTVVINHDTNTVVWVKEGFGKAVFDEFLSELSEEQRASIEMVSGDGARWIDACIAEKLPHAKRCVDPFHVAQWINDQLNNVRKRILRQVGREIRTLKDSRDELSKTIDSARKNGTMSDELEASLKQVEEDMKSKESLLENLKRGLYALCKRPEDLTRNQQKCLEAICKADAVLKEAYECKEMMRRILKFKLNVNIQLWIDKAAASGIEEFVGLAEKLARHKENLTNALQLGLSNARVEGTNNKIKVLLRRAYGFRNLENLKDAILLCCSPLADQLLYLTGRA